MMRKIVLIVVFLLLSTMLSWAKQTKPVYKWGFINKSGVHTIPARYDEVSDFHEGLAAVKVKSSWGYVNKAGKVIIHPRFTTAGDFSEGFAAVSIHGRYGFIDKKGQFVIKPTYLVADDFYGGLAAVKAASKWGYINKKDVLVINPRFDGIGMWGFRSGLATVYIGKKTAVINKTGGFVMQPTDKYLGPFTEGMAYVIENKKWGYIDQTGRTIIRPQYYSAWPFSEGLAVVKDMNLTCRLIDRSGRTVAVLADGLEINNRFTEGLIPALRWEPMKRGFMNAKGNMEIDFKFDRVDGFYDGFAAAAMGRWSKTVKDGTAKKLVDLKWGFIDHSGRYIIKPTLVYPDDVPRRFSAGLVAAPVRVSHADVRAK